MTGAALADSASLAQTLRELDALPTPAGCDAQTFAELKSALRKLLFARQVSKFTSAAPGSSRSQVMDLAVQDYGGSPQFHWSYASEGDYNQDSVVNVQDLAPLGIHWGKDSAAADWATACVTDGNANGKVEIGDLTSLGANFLYRVEGYHLERSDTDDAGGTWAQVADIEFGASSVLTGVLRQFDHLLDGAEAGYYRVVPYDGANDGIASNVVQWIIPVPPVWQMGGHDAQHTRRSPFHGPATGAIKWAFQTEWAVQSSPAIGADGALYVGSNDNTLYAINADGTLKWKFPTESAIHCSPILATDGTVYFNNRDGKIYAINSDGSLQWLYDPGGPSEHSLVMAGDGTLYIDTGKQKLNAINPDGTLKWAYQLELNAEIYEPAIGQDGTIYGGGGMDYLLYAINPDGSLKWCYKGPNLFYCSSPVISPEGRVYTANFDGNVYAIDPDGSLQWTCPAPGSVYSSLALSADGTLFTGGWKLYAINPNGSMKWSYEAPEMFLTAPALDADGVIYIGGTIDVSTGMLDAILPDGSLKWSTPLGSATHPFADPAIGPDGSVFIGDDLGELVAIGPGGG